MQPQLEICLYFEDRDASYKLKLPSSKVSKPLFSPAAAAAAYVASFSCSEPPVFCAYPGSILVQVSMHRRSIVI